MRRSAALIIAVLLLVAGGTSAQDVELPPGVLLLSQVKRHVLAELQQLPEYTCLETVQRSTTIEKAPKRSENRKLLTGARDNLVPLDTLRLEVLYSDHKEWYASPGASNFSSESPISYVDSGMIGDGIFASHLSSIFNNAVIRYSGEETVAHERGWKKAARYDFHISEFLSGWNITVPGGSATVAAKGSFWADPETHELLRLEVHADEIPPALPVADVIITSSYARMPIGSDAIMLPQSSEMRVILPDESESLDQFEFTHCRSYHAQSSISFATSGAVANAPAPGPPGRARAADIQGALPPGLVVPVTLTTEVGNDSAVGALLKGRVSSPVDLRGKNVIPEGSPIHGRIRRLERYEDAGGYFIVGLEFTEVDVGGTLYRFYADMQSASGAPGLQWVISTSSGVRDLAGAAQVSRSETIRIPDLPGVGSFFIRSPRFSLPAGFQMQWKTRSLK